MKYFGADGSNFSVRREIGQITKTVTGISVPKKVFFKSKFKYNVDAV